MKKPVALPEAATSNPAGSLPAAGLSRRELMLGGSSIAAASALGGLGTAVAGESGGSDPSRTASLSPEAVERFRDPGQLAHMYSPKPLVNGAGMRTVKRLEFIEADVGERLFSDEELDLIATPLSIHLERAVAKRDASRIDWIVEQMDMECLAIHDSYLQWIAVLQTYIVQQAGETRHDEALRQMSEAAFRDFVLHYRGMDAAAHIAALASRLRAAGSTFTIEEHADRYRFRLDPWGGAIRQWRKPHDWQATQPRQRQGEKYIYPNYGAYAAPDNLVVLGSARHLTQSRENLPCYIACEVLFLEILAIQHLGYPIAVIELPETADGIAYLDVYKNPADVPEAVYLRVGFSKPRAGYPDWSVGRHPGSEDLAQFTMPLSLQVRNAAEASDWGRLQQISTLMDDELVRTKDAMGILIAGLLTWIARALGEDAAEEALAFTAEIVMAPYVEAVRGLELRDAIQLWAMVWRSHGSTFDIEEHADTFVFMGRPLGACGRMWASAYQKSIERISESRIRYPTFGCYDPPMNFHLMKEPRGITYGKTNYPIYSAHSHMLHEIYATRELGHPLWVEHNPLDDRDGEIIHIHYKDPKRWPDEVFRRLGISRPD